MGAGYAMASPLHEVETFGSNPGNLQMFIHVPSDLGAGAPLVVVAHACLQTAHDVAANSGWVELSDTYGFALVFPQTSKDNEPAGGCFRTWQPEHQKRGDGEPLSVGQMIEWMLEHHDLDRDRVFIAGMSSGGLLTGVMLATYPDLFAAGAMLSAYPFKCAGSFEELKPCAAGEKELTAEKWGELVLTGYPEFSGPRPRVSIWHGGADSLILPVNLDLQLEQWTQAAGIDRDPDEVDVIAGNQRRRYNDRTGDQIVETYLIEGMNHAVAVSPNGTPRCGIAAPFFADVDICAALWNARWFGIIR
jgi:poly(hydroxyalkanoate) depolymerase family esterase